MRCPRCEEGRMVAGKETRFSGGIAVIGSCLRLIGGIAFFASVLLYLFGLRAFVRPELLEGYPPKGDLVTQWTLAVVCLSGFLFQVGGFLCGKRKTLTCSDCEEVISGGAERPFPARALSLVVALGFLACGGYLAADAIYHFDLPRYQEASSAVWNGRLAAEFDAWAARQPDGFREEQGWGQAYTGPVAERLLGGGPEAKRVLEHLRDHGGTEAAGILLGR